MKTKLIVSELAVCVGLTLMCGCNKEEPSNTGAVKTSEGAASEASKAVDPAKATAQQAADQAATQVKAAQQQAQGIIDKAKGQVSEQKFSDALATLNQLANVKLTSEQQKLVDSLKTQIQNALGKAAASNPASALGGALGK